MASTFKRTGLLRRFKEDRSGNFSIVAGAAISMLALAVGYGVNVAQIYNVRSNLIASLDSALISAGRDISTGAIKETEAAKAIKLYLAANGDPAVNNGSHELVLVEPITINKTAKTITATAYVDVDAFLPLFGEANRTRVATTAGTIYSDVKVEVGLMLDVTGSMLEKGTPKDGANQTKLDNLKDAAKGAISNMMGRNLAGLEPRVRMSIIPYSYGVNTGVLDDAVYAEDKNWSDIPVGLSFLDTLLGKLLKLDLLAKRKDTDACATERKKDDGKGNAVFDVSDSSPYDAMVNRDDKLKKDTCPTTAVVPLTSNTQRLLDTVDDFEGGGSTAGHIGIQWTRYMLSPNWGSFLEQKAKGSAPANYPKSTNPAVRKIAVLMTDGEFNTAYAKRNKDDTSDNSSRSQNFAQQLCTAMKADNIEVFTIGFMLKEKDAQDTMAKCASPDTKDVKYYYNATNAAELEAAFDAVAKNVEVLRLTQ